MISLLCYSLYYYFGYYGYYYGLSASPYMVTVIITITYDHYYYGYDHYYYYGCWWFTG